MIINIRPIDFNVKKNRIVGFKKTWAKSEALRDSSDFKSEEDVRKRD